ncbi:MAG: hypothetical protein KAU46_05785 [Candidatus Aminicenantes bacterium]|nr:hypothetical protein [Candidatus Aminicenantes bacterium]
MSWSIYAILIIFAAFILLLILNPNLSCFGKKLKSPFYPLLRRKKKKKKVKTDDYGFSLVDEGDKQKAVPVEQKLKAESPDFSRIKDVKQEISAKKKKVKTDDYGFSLVDEEDK